MKCTIDDGVRSQPLDGPLSAHIIGFAKWVRDEGYALYTRHREVRLAASVSRWVGRQGISIHRITSAPASRRVLLSLRRTLTPVSGVQA